MPAMSRILKNKHLHYQLFLLVGVVRVVGLIFALPSLLVLEGKHTY